MNNNIDGLLSDAEVGRLAGGSLCDRFGHAAAGGYCEHYAPICWVQVSGDSCNLPAGHDGNHVQLVTGHVPTLAELEGWQGIPLVDQRAAGAAAQRAAR